MCSVIFYSLKDARKSPDILRGEKEMEVVLDSEFALEDIKQLEKIMSLVMFGMIVLGFTLFVIYLIYMKYNLNKTETDQ